MTGTFFIMSAGFFLALVCGPFLFGIINRVKAFCGGRQGRPLLQMYFDIYKLWGKTPVYPYSTSWVFRLGPLVNVAAVLLVLCFVPFGGNRPFFSFTGDFVLVAGLFAMMRFSLVLGALDTGSAFEGMGAAREALFGAMAEPILLLVMVCLAYHSGEASLASMIGSLELDQWVAKWPVFILLCLGLFLLLLVENCRIPADDPNTHLELTMIHEVMILDHSGPELALIEYASSLKLWLFCQIIASLLLPSLGGTLLFQSAPAGSPAALFLHMGAMVLLICFLAALVGLVESSMARLRMERVPQIMTLAASFTCLAALMLWR